MRILYVSLSSYDYNTSAMIRNKALINGMLQNGNTIDFLTIGASQISKYYDGTSELLDNLNIIKLEDNKIYKNFNKTQNSKNTNVLKKIFVNIIKSLYHRVSLFDNTIITAMKINNINNIQKYYDVIISSSDPKSSHFAVNRLIKLGLRYGKWIEYWGDPLLNDITRKSILPKWYIKQIEKKLFYNADKICYVSPFTCDEQKKIFFKYADKMCFLPIAYKEKKIYENQQLKIDTVKLGYFGDYNDAVRNIIPLYNCCKEYGIKLCIAGNSNLELEDTKNIMILPRVNKVRLDELEADTDILICIINKYGLQIPGKIYHYAATNKPILIILDGPNKEKIRKYLFKFDRFVLCDNSKVSINEAINRIIEDKRNYEPSPYFEARKIAKSMLSLINKKEIK